MQEIPFDQQITKVNRDTQRIIDQISSFKITNDDDYKQSAAFLVGIKQSTKFIDEIFASQMDEAKEAKRLAEANLRRVKDKIDFFKSPLSKAEQNVKKIMSEYQTAQEELRRVERQKAIAEEEERRLQYAIKSGTDAVLDIPINVEKKISEKPKADGTYTVETWHYEITDVTRISSNYMIPDEKAIAKVVKTMKDKAPTVLGGGVRVYSTSEIRARA